MKTTIPEKNRYRVPIEYRIAENGAPQAREIFEKSDSHTFDFLLENRILTSNLSTFSPAALSDITPNPQNFACGRSKNK